MAQHQADREDLLREATALRVRGEFRIDGWDNAVVAGRRDHGGWSVYFGSDPCFHFDAEGRLRRAFADGKLYRTQGTTLAALVRKRTPNVTNLLRRDLDRIELTVFLDALHARFAALHAAIREGRAVLVGQHPDDGEIERLFGAWLAEWLSAAPGLAPRIK